MSDYKFNQEFAQLFALKPYMDIHMNASLRNDYNNFRKRDKKPIEGNLMNMGGIGVGFGLPQRMNQPPQPFIGVNQPLGMNPIGLGMNPPNLPNLGNLPNMMPPTNNPNFGRPFW